MPFTPADAKQKNKKIKSDAHAKLWADVANSELAKQKKAGKSDDDAEGIATSAAHSAVAKAMEKQEGDPVHGGDILQEYADSRGLSLRVDKTAAVIHGVKVLGAVSLKGREYPAAVMEKAKPMYEGRVVNIDHVDPNQRRSYRDRIGCLKGVTLKEDGMYADLHYNPKHVLAEQLVWDAENAPNNLGFSHDARGPSKLRNGRVVVESIDRVLSVDLVANPATTNGLFESADMLNEGMIADKIAADDARQDLCKLCMGAMDMIRSALYDTDNLSTVQSAAKVKSILADWTNELTNPSTDETQESQDMDLKTLTLSTLKAERPDLLAALQEDLTQGEAAKQAAAEQKVLQEELTTLRAEKASRVLQEAIDGELRAAKIDPTDKVSCSPAFLKTLQEAKDSDARKLLIEDRTTILSRGSATRHVGPVTAGVPAPASFAVESREQWAARHRSAR